MFAIKRNNLFVALLTAVLTAGIAEGQQEAPGTLDVYTGVWPPYVESGAEAPGQVTNIVRTIFDDMGYEVRVRHFGFAYIFDRVERGEALVAFPYFQTDDRIGEVLFSDPVFEVVSRVYYNRRAFPDGPPTSTGQEPFGNVSGYRFGGEIDELLSQADARGHVTSFDNEQEAIAALLNDEIRFLPMTSRVAQEVLSREFASERALIAPLESITDDAQPLRVIFPVGEEALRDAFNQSLNRLRADGLIATGDRQTSTRSQCETVAEIVALDDVPLVLAEDAQERSFALPQGSRVAVCQWSESILSENGDARFFDIMNDTSEVLVLDGPQAGRTLNVANMHLAIVE